MLGGDNGLLNKLAHGILTRNFLLKFACALALAIVFWPAGPARSDNFVFYFPDAHQIVPLVMIGETKYLPLLQVLNLVVKVGGLQERGNSITVWFGNTQLELHDADNRVRVNREKLSLAEPVRVSNGQWGVPVDFLTLVLPKLTREPIEYQVGTNRVYIGNVKPSSFTVRVDQLPNGARLTLQFTDPVTVRTASQNGQWVMTLGGHPLEPLEQSYHFQDAYVRELRFDDQDGVPKLVLTPTSSGFNFYPVMAEGGKVLLADVLKPPPVSAEQPRQAESPAQAGPIPAGIEELPEAQPGPPLPVVVLDAGHGDTETGGRSRDGLFEKDLVAQLVARVRQAVLETRRFRILLTRVGDTNPTLDQRELAANTARPFVFLTFHAGNLGSSPVRVAIYSYRAPSWLAGAKPEVQKNAFIPWAHIQRLHADRSRQFAQMLRDHLSQIPALTADDLVEAPVRALRSVDAPALAIELGSLSPETDAAPLADAELQRAIAAAVVQGLEDFQGS